MKLPARADRRASSWAMSLAVFLVLGFTAPARAATWRAGIARVAITPKQPMWMAGYAARNHPSEGKLHDLWAKAVVLDDGSGRKAALVTLDVCGIGRDLSLEIRNSLKTRLGLDRDRVVLACSHTHTGPVVGTNLITMYQIDDEQRRRIDEYARFFVAAVVDVVARAAASLDPAVLSWETGRADFAVNRRNNKEPEIPALRERMELKGPDDHDVPVLRVAAPDGRIRAVVFGYACHCTVLGIYKFSGDYAGFAQIALEEKYPGSQAMFIAGCGADQNPLPRHKVELAEAYGSQLAKSVQHVLDRPMRPIDSPLQSADDEVGLKFGPLPSRQQVQDDTKSQNFYTASRARKLLKTFEIEGHLESTYPYPVQVWRMGDLTWIFLGGEVVVDYAQRIKRNLGGSHTWVSAYCNDVMAYIPSLRVLKEGGYEGGGAMVYYGLPAPWSEEVEEQIVASVRRSVRTTAPGP